MTFIKTVYGKISLIFLALLIIMTTVQFFLMTDSTQRYSREAEQKLNQTLAKDMASEFQEFLTDSIDKKNIDHLIHYMMVMNHRLEIYILDSKGNVKGFWAEPGKSILRNKVHLKPINTFLKGRFDFPLFGTDPRHNSGSNIFSVAELEVAGEKGYLYVILSGQQYSSNLALIKGSYIYQLFLQNFLIVFSITMLLGFSLFFAVTKKLNAIRNVLKEFKDGNQSRRIHITGDDELSELASTFNQMADKISENIEDLKQTDRQRRELVANVSHDLRSPVSSIQGYLETLLMKNEELNNDEIRSFLEVAYKNSRYLNMLIDQLFELSKFDANEIKPILENFLLQELLQDVTMKFKQKADDKCVAIHCNFNATIPAVSADIALIERVLSNLIENAINYSNPEASIEIELSTSGKNVLVSISDNGIGIPEDEIPFIFDRFYKVEKSRSDFKKSAGLGLAITKKILELHNSYIECKSRVNLGTTFRFNLNAVI
jgi:signal transduction histidine kinase